jgi:hypothetical protein
MEEFIVHRNKMLSLAALACAFVWVLVAIGDARAQQTGAPADVPLGVEGSILDPWNTKRRK